METLLGNIKAVVQNDVNLRTYIKNVEIIFPRTIPDTAIQLCPSVCIAPINSPEEWYSNKKKLVTHTVEIYAIVYIQKLETAMIGDGSMKGLTDILSDLESALRGNTFSDYLSKPTDITNVSYGTTGEGDNLYIGVGVITLQCERLFSTA